MRSEKSPNLSPGAIRTAIIEFLSDVRVLTLATSAANIPWACTLAYAYDEQLNLYCITNKETRHVQEIVQNSKVSVALHEHQSPTYDPKSVKGLQLEATAELLSGNLVEEGLQIFVNRFPLAEEMSRERLFKLKTARIIKIKPQRLFYLDRADIGPRVELELT